MPIASSPAYAPKVGGGADTRVRLHLLHTQGCRAASLAPPTLSSHTSHDYQPCMLKGTTSFRRSCAYPRCCCLRPRPGFDNIYALKSVEAEPDELETLGIDQLIPRRRICKTLQVSGSFSQPWEEMTSRPPTSTGSLSNGRHARRCRPVVSVGSSDSWPVGWP